MLLHDNLSRLSQPHRWAKLACFNHAHHHKAVWLISVSSSGSNFLLLLNEFKDKKMNHAEKYYIKTKLYKLEVPMVFAWKNILNQDSVLFFSKINIYLRCKIISEDIKTYFQIICLSINFSFLMVHANNFLQINKYILLRFMLKTRKTNFYFFLLKKLYCFF